MKQKNLYFYTNILAWGLVLLLIGNYVFGWTTPSGDPPGSNLPAPINVSSTAQTKAGNLIIEGVLRLGQFATAPSGTEGALYFNTTEKKMKVYSNSAWGDLGGGAVPGLLPNYTTAQRDALSPATGQQIYNTTENKVQVYGSGAWIAVSAKLALAATCTLDGDCDSTHCVDGVCCNTACSGTICQTCGALSSAGLGYCGYVNSSSNDPRNTCATASPPAVDSCKSPNCNGTGYACGYLSGEVGQPTCKRCPGNSYDPVTIVDAQDTEGSNLCNTVHWRCSSGTCTKSTCSTVYPCVYSGYIGQSCTTACTNAGQCGCLSACNYPPDYCGDCPGSCSSNTFYCVCRGWVY